MKTITLYITNPQNYLSAIDIANLIMLSQKSYFYEKEMQAMMDFAAQFSSRLIIVVITYEPYVTFSFLLR